MESKPAGPQQRGLFEYAMISARGFCMGCADVVPGVSGGTMAFILGIYEELIHSIRILTSKEMVAAIFSLEYRKVLEIAPWKFLGSLLLGVGVAILSLAKVLEWCLEEHPVLLWSFFFGLVLASVFAVAKRKTAWTTGSVAAIVVGTVLAYIIVGLVPLQTPDAAWFLFLSGAIAICAMILPGISGSFMLVILGKYETVLRALNEWNFQVLFFVALGCGVGILTFARVLGWFFRNYHNLTIALLIGLMVGSLRKIWPWKDTLEWIEDRHGHLKPVHQVNTLPPEYASEFWTAVFLAAVGFAVVLVLDRLANRGNGVQPPA